jgi:transcriptional regulator with XRE-family HTH domain
MIDNDEQTIHDIENITLESTLAAFNYTLKDIKDFARDTGLDYQTIKGWERNNKVSNSGKVTLYYILKCRELQDKLANKDLSDNKDLENFNKLKEVLKDIFEK